jgi:DJ-1 family protein
MRKPKVLALVSSGVEEMELVITVDLLRRASIDVDITSINEKVVECSRMVKIVPDKVINSSEDKEGFLEDFLKEYDALFIAGGSVNSNNLKKQKIVKEIIDHFIKEEKIISAICAGPTVINHHYKLNNYQVTCYPTLKEEVPNFVDQEVVVDKNLITSQGPATTFSFALKLIEKLKNKETMQLIAKATLYEKNS